MAAICIFTYGPAELIGVRDLKKKMVPGCGSYLTMYELNIFYGDPFQWGTGTFIGR